LWGLGGLCRRKRQREIIESNSRRTTIDGGFNITVRNGPRNGQESIAEITKPRWRKTSFRTKKTKRFNREGRSNIFGRNCSRGERDVETRIVWEGKKDRTDRIGNQNARARSKKKKTRAEIRLGEERFPPISTDKKGKDSCTMAEKRIETRGCPRHVERAIR